MIHLSHPRLWAVAALALFAAPAVYFSAAGSGPAHDPLELSGLLAAAEITIESPLSAPIANLPVREGDLVTPGQLLVELDRTHTAAAVSAQRARLDALRARLSRVQKAHDLARRQSDSAIANLEARLAAGAKDQAEVQARIREITPERTRVEAGILVRQENDTQALRLQLAQTELRLLDERQLAARGELDQLRLANSAAAAGPPELAEIQAATAEATAALEEAVAAAKSASVLAPKHAIVTVRSAAAGQLAHAGQTLLVLHDLDEIWAQVYVPETRISSVRAGQSARVRLASGQTVEGVVSSTAAEADFATQHDSSRTWRDLRTFGVRVRLPNPDRRLRPGMSASVELK